MFYSLAAIALVIGVLLGLLGGGGSILTVPVLVYLAGMTVKNAIVASLIVVGITSSIAVIGHARRKCVCWKTGILFGGAGMAGAYIGGRLTAYIPDAVLLAMFALVMLGSAAAMLGKRQTRTERRASNESFCAIDLPVLAILIDGLMVGMITGLVGVGGGFLLVPALNFLAGLPIHAAIGTSLLIIVLQSGAALFGHASHFTPDWTLIVFFTGFAVLGSFLGSLLSAKISGPLLKKGFGVFILVLGSYLLIRQTDTATLQQIQALYIEHRKFILGMLSSLALMLAYQFWVWIHTPR